MATFVLIHGSSVGGWCWQRLAYDLRAANHDIYTPTLTGLGERRHLLSPDVSLSTHIQDIVNVLFYGDLREVILVGWSYGGLVIPGVAEQIGDRLTRLVYLDAFIPEHGQAAYDIVNGLRESSVEDTVDVNGVRTKAPFSRETMVRDWGITDPDILDWMEARLTPMPLATLEEPVHLPLNRAAQIPTSYILCTGSRGLGANLLQPMADKAKSRSWDYHELEAGHASMVTGSGELASLLSQIAGNER